MPLSYLSCSSTTRSNTVERSPGRVVAHNLKFGANVIRRQFSLVQSATPRGQFTFNASTANAPAPLNVGLANFMVGSPVTITRQASLYKPGYRSWETGYYVQDD